VTSGLAWAGLVVVVAVPAVEVVKSRLAPDDEVALASPLEPVKRPVATPVVERTEVEEAAAASVPAITPSTAKGSALQQYLATGKKLPDYITTAPSSTEKAPAPQVVAAVPAKPAATTPAPAAPAAASAPAIASVPAPPAAEQVAATNPAPAPVPMAPAARPKPAAKIVTEADLKDWKSGTLEDFLKQRGLLTPLN
jgi:hypothetical protein